jgi:hypothetical protein
VIESAYGKLRQFEGNHVISGFTRLLLSFFSHEDRGVVSTVPSGEGFISHLANGSGMDICLPSRKISAKNFTIT